MLSLIIGQNHSVDDNFISIGSFGSHDYYLYTSGAPLNECTGSTSGTCNGNMTWVEASNYCQSNNNNS